jgi:adenine-specific DNA methylase
VREILPRYKQLNLLEDEITVEGNSFRPIHYLGSKLRILDLIESTINSIDPSYGGVCDLFAGTGSVSLRLSSNREITAVDVQEYSRVICSALLNGRPLLDNLNVFVNECSTSKFLTTIEWCFAPLIQYEEQCIALAMSGKPELLADFLENSSLITQEATGFKSGSRILIQAMKDTLSRLHEKKLNHGAEALVSKYFGGLYFSFKQAIHLDVALHHTEMMEHSLRDTYLAGILSTASSIVNTVGKQFAQPIRPRTTEGKIKNSLGKYVNKDRSIDVFKELQKWFSKYCELSTSGRYHHVLRMDYMDALNHLNPDVKVVYADPPYTRDHYSRYYHVLETMCLRDNPGLSTMVLDGKKQISRGVYREDRHQSPFCIKSQAPQAFERLASKVSSLGAALVLSYSPYDVTKKSHPRLLTMEQLLKIVNDKFNHVEVISPGEFVHSKLTHSEKHLEASGNAEVLIVCQP